MDAYRVIWRFTNGQTLDETKFYISDDKAIAAAKRRMKYALPGEIAVLMRGGVPVARIKAGFSQALTKQEVA
jgi:hypothetical protein